MNRMIRSKVVKIGSSYGILIPPDFLEQAGLTYEVQITVDGNRMIIQANRHSRQGWEDHFARMAKLGDDRLLEEPPSTQ